MTPDDIKRLIAKDKISQVFKMIKNNLMAKDYFDEIILLERQYYQTAKHLRKGLITHESALITKNRICNALLKIIDEIFEDENSGGVKNGTNQNNERHSLTMIGNGPIAFNGDITIKGFIASGRDTVIHLISGRGLIYTLVIAFVVATLSVFKSRINGS